MTAIERVIAVVEAALRTHVEPDESVCVALSGGLDSIVLLDAVANIRDDVFAIHVHHGLSPNADAWAAFCQEMCAGRGISLQVHRVSVERRGRGLEAAARAARYAAYAAVASRWILQAHHADDAVETLLLRLNRGTGLRGLAGIPMTRALDARHTLLRPLLELPRDVLSEYSQVKRLRWIEDESNGDIRFDRNFLRQQVRPVIAQRFPAWRENWVRASAHVRTAQRLLDDLAEIDVGARPARLSLTKLRGLSSDRLCNALRYVLSVRGVDVPETAHLADIERRIRTCRADATLDIVIGPVALMHYRGELHCVPANRAGAAASFRRLLKGAQSVTIPELNGTLHFAPVTGAGIAAAHPDWASLVVRGREVAESMKPDPRRPTRSLKNLFQEAGIPPWERAWLPRIVVREQLVWVESIGVATAWQACSQEAGWMPRWEPQSMRPG
ncbi:MAG: tRNA lysidine(34) synthetase TilS [Betaproteobacteria bacterium]|nr:tRNA lysidine(34) synthetase TilS [Betaproteobacteria bacterium]